MGDKENKFLPYRVDRYKENITSFPEDLEIDPPGNLGWLRRHYREDGRNINTLREDIIEAFGHHYNSGYDCMLDLYTALYDKRKVHSLVRAANDDEPDRRRDALRLYDSLDQPELRLGWFATWKPPEFGPVKKSPFTAFTSNYARVHTRLYRDAAVALLTTGNPSPYP